MTFDEAISQIESGSPEPVYFLHGHERFFQTELIAALKRKYITEENRDFNLEIYDARASSVGDWLAATQTLPFMGGTKLVLVNQLNEAGLKANEAEPLLEYLERPASDICLVLTADQADKKKNVFKTLIKIKGAITTEPPPEPALIPWIRKRAQAEGYRLAADAARRMIDHIGARPGLLASELEKLITFAGKEKDVTEEHVLSVVGEIRQENPFALTEALKEKNAQKALSLLDNQLEHGEDPIKVMGMIAWQLRVIWEVKAYQAKKIPPVKIAGEMGAKPFLVEKAMKHTGRFSCEELRRGFQHLAQADRDLKTTGKDPEGVLQTLVLRLCSA
ncbi:MAG: DNA polymerase III subunit delta [Nitrospinaceae bacterium]|jgi:DNA polymerase-3 subunit delta|nr:MAG: DNA polymerase III subunit delta [Nitrospinaceae bacterium]